MEPTDSEKLKEIEKLLEAALTRINELRGNVDEESRYLGVLKRLHEEGGKVTREKFREIGGEFGYDPRGLGGFFTGNGPLTTIVEGGDEYFALTPTGIKTLKTYGVI